MGIPAEPKVERSRGGLGTAGMALPAAVLGLVAISVLAAATWMMVDLNRVAAENREAAARALHLAESGAAHALGLLQDELGDTSFTRLLRGSDNATGTSDDGMLTGYTLDGDLEIPITGRTITGGTYFVQLFDDPADTDGDSLTDSNFQILARCSGLTDDGASAAVDIVIGVATLPGIASGGDLKINGNPDILGPCGGAHANQTVEVSGNPTVQTTVSASDTVEVSGHIRDPWGGTVQPLHHQPPIEIPDLDPWAYCGEADFILRSNGYLVEVGPPRDSIDARSDEVHGWKRSSDDPVIWDASGNSVAAGTYCIEGNAKVSGNPQGPGNSALSMSLLATGSIEFSGNPKIEAAHSEGILILAAGDVSVSGNPSGSTDNYGGLVYAGSQCRVSGNPTLGGQVLCADDPDPAGSVNYAAQNEISGNPTIRYDCGGVVGGNRRVLFWLQRIGA